jgi:hypothetical protein
MEIFAIIVLFLFFVALCSEIIRLHNKLDRLAEENSRTISYISIISNSLQDIPKISGEFQDGLTNQSKTIKDVADHSISVSKNLEEFQSTVYKYINVLSEQIKLFSAIKSKTSVSQLPSVKKNDKNKPD